MKIVSKIYLFTLNLLFLVFFAEKFVFSKIFYSKIETADCFKPTFPYINIPKNYVFKRVFLYIFLPENLQLLYFKIAVVYFILIFYTYGLEKLTQSKSN